MEMKNLKKVAHRIKKAIKKRENIILYGDADLDGISSVIILKETINSLGGKITQIYFPSRESEGYGITEKGLFFLKDLAPALLISLDCGISNFKEIDLARKMNFEVIIIDHHEVLEKLPAASIVLDPKQKGDKYPFKWLATAGIALKLAQEILKSKLSPILRKNFLELTALATLADLMPQEGENQEIIEEGLVDLKNSWRPGIAVFWQIEEIKNSQTFKEACQKIVSALNTIEMKENFPQTYLLLTADDFSQAKELAQNLLRKRDERQKEIKEIIEQVKERISQKENEPCVFEGDVNWPLISIGAVASRICNLYQKPVFLYSKKEKLSRGAVRTPPGINSIELMKKCSKHLVTFGGHSQASGFTIENENLEKFKQCLITNLSQ